MEDNPMLRMPEYLSPSLLGKSFGGSERTGHGQPVILRDDGATLVEMALSCAILFAMFFAIFEFSLALYSMHFVADTAREASRYAMVNGSACTAMPDCGFTDTGTTLQNWVTNNLAYPGIDTTQLTVTSSWYYPNPSGTQNPTWTACGAGSTCNDPGDMVKVTVTYPFFLSIPFWKATTFNITSSSEMVISQ